MGKIRVALSVLTKNPPLFLRIVAARLRAMRPLPASPVSKDIKGVNFTFDFSYDPVIKLMYSGGYEVPTVAAMRKFLKPGDTFVDVGANIGYLSAIALGLVGRAGQVHSFEPVPQYFQKLQHLALANKDYHIVVNQCALGEKRGRAKIDITSLANIGWATMVPGFMSQSTRRESVEVPVSRLDDYIRENRLDKISLIKIDTEGYEFFVLKGLQCYLENIGHRPLILCEVAPSAYPLLGYTLEDLRSYLKKYSYEAFSLINIGSKVDIAGLERTTNVLFRAG